MVRLRRAAMASAAWGTRIEPSHQDDGCDDGGTELLYKRAMNVWGSGGAHKSYFRKVDDAFSKYSIGRHFDFFTPPRSSLRASGLDFDRS